MLVDTLPLVLLALYAFFFGISLLQFIAPWEDKVSGPAFLEYHHAVDRYMAVWARALAQLQLALSLLLLVLECQQWQTIPYWCRVIALGFVISSVVVAVTGNVPLNTIMNSWSAEQLPSNWFSIRSQWLAYHRLRAWFSVAAFVFFSVSLLLN